MDTIRTLNEIEIALAKTDKFNYIKNIVVFNVNGLSETLPVFHECDMLVCSKSGYLTEIEIKRSWSDFLNDFKKKHNHNNFGIIKYLYYCIPLSIFEKVQIKLEEEYDKRKNKDGFNYSGIITYDESLNIKFHSHRFKVCLNNKEEYHFLTPTLNGYKKLFIEQQLELARLGTIRLIGLKEKLKKYELN